MKEETEERRVGDWVKVVVLGEIVGDLGGRDWRRNEAGIACQEEGLTYLISTHVVSTRGKVQIVAMHCMFSAPWAVACGVHQLMPVGHHGQTTTPQVRDGPTLL